jgi:hypothetical protein
MIYLAILLVAVFDFLFLLFLFKVAYLLVVGSSMRTMDDKRIRSKVQYAAILSATFFALSTLVIRFIEVVGL